MSLPSFRQLLGAAALAGLLLALPDPALGQQGTIAGRITDQSTGLAVIGAEIIIAGTTRRALTDQTGQYRFDNVGPGQVELRARFIGYATASRTLAVEAGGSATADFALSASAITLDAVVATATGDQRNRQIGNAISTIGAADLATKAPITTMSDLLNSRAPGLTILPSSGTTGTGTRVRIRGANSLSLSNEPVIVVDGIRVNSDEGSFSIFTGGQQPSRLNDLNPEDIESIDVIKGPSAAALYGTNAANGVIQVRTKRGRAGPTRWTVYAEGGSVTEPTQWPANYTSRTNTGASCTLSNHAAGTCTIDTVRSFNPLEVFSPFRTGTRQQYGLSASGGTQTTNFYTSGEFEREKGVYLTNDLRRVSLRANIRNQARENLDFAASTGYTSSDLGFPDNDNNALGIASSGLLGFADTTTVPGSRGYGFLTPEQSYAVILDQSVERFIGSLTANYRPWSFLTARAVIGTDVANRQDSKTFPPGLVPLNVTTFEGTREINRAQTLTYTANFNFAAAFQVSPEVHSNTSIGLQYVKDRVHRIDAFGRKLVAGSGSLGGTVVPAVGEAIGEAVTLGSYIEQQVALRDRLFLTAAVRGDDNSAFGKDFEFIIYPKLSASWVISDEPFFPTPAFLNSLRLRVAWGRSGIQPGTTDALQFFTPVPVADAGTDVPGLTIGNLGNPDLKPERTQELELGLDADLWDQRVKFEFTYYNKTSNDALIARRLAPSLGVSAVRFENLGEVNNKGVEILVNAQVLDRPDLGWNVTATAFGNRNRLIELGEGITPIIFGLGGASQRHTEGAPLGGYWMVPYNYVDLNNDGLLTTSEVVLGSAPVYLGTPLPTHGGSLSTELMVKQRVRLFALLDGRFGHSQFNSTEQFRCGFVICRARRDPSAPLADQARAVANLLGTQAGYIESAAFVKLREVSLTFLAPEEWAAKLNAGTLSLTLSGRNLATWTDYTGIDPELNNSGQTNFSTAEFLTQPPVRYFIVRLNLTF
ncbi:MAG: SusC/RagA family TonB-linked outer membrane protein [Gemmatimonadales bacterium]